MDDTELASMLVRATRVELYVDEYFVPDGGPPTEYVGPRAVVVAFGGTLAALTAAGLTTRELPDAVAIEILDAAAHARAELVPDGIDTAVGRTITTLGLRVDHARGPTASFTAIARVNHCAPRALPPAWSALLHAVAAALGATWAGRDAWQLAMRWVGPVG